MRGFVIAALCAVLYALYMRSGTNGIPAHMLHHKLTATPDIMDRATQQELLALLKQWGDANATAGGFATNDQDAKATKPTHEHVGEGIPLAAGGSCAHRLMVPSIDRSQCTLPQRLDVAKHFLTYGGTAALKERYAKSIGRLLSFGRYIFNPQDFPVIQRLFNSETFLAAARGVCPAAAQHLDPFQFNFIVQLPGQSVATHIDGVYFWGASRFHVPQWLLAAMKFSGLYEERFVDQVQVVAYFHEWDAPHAGADSSAGDFAYYASGDRAPRTVKPAPRSGNCVDGSKTVHAATVYERGGREPPRLQKSQSNKLVYLGGERWELRSDGVRNGAPYTTDDLRLSLVFRARCFKDAPTAAKFNEQLRDPSAQLSLDGILEKLSVYVGRKPGEAAAMSRLELALDIVSKAVRYPLPDVLVPWNVCMLDKALPAAEPIVRFFCGE
jgi:hypothetical protein